MSLSNKEKYYITKDKTMSSKYKELPTGKVECLKCGSVVTRGSYNRHTSTQKHLNSL